VSETDTEKIIFEKKKETDTETETDTEKIIFEKKKL
jgi:hypothetical protein